MRAPSTILRVPLQAMLAYIRRHGLMRPGDRVGVAVSGGADSVALLRLLLEARAELGVVLSVVHFNHKIRGAEADADEQFVRELAGQHGLEFHCDSDDVPAFAEENKLSLEDAARRLRYFFFDRLTDDAVDQVATAHTRDDQAETVLMRLLRGSGTKGLAGIYPGVGGWIGAGVSTGKNLAGPRIVRPVLGVARAELRAYLERVGQSWREDASNLDLDFTRNRLRHEILPALRQINPNLDKVLSDTADVARAEEDWWKTWISEERDVWGPWHAPRPGEKMEPPHMLVDRLTAKPLAVQRRIVRCWLESSDFQPDFDHVEAVLALASGEAGRAEKTLELPRGVVAIRQGKKLWVRRQTPSTQLRAYSLALLVPGEWEVAGRKIRASLVSDRVEGGPAGNYVRVVRLRPELSQSLSLRNWHAGDRYQPAHTSKPRKLKELLQSPHIPRAQKPFWPVVVSGEQIVWVPGFEAPEEFRAKDEGPALMLEEVEGLP